MQLVAYPCTILSDTSSTSDAVVNDISVLRVCFSFFTSQQACETQNPKQVNDVSGF